MSVDRNAAREWVDDWTSLTPAAKEAAVDALAALLGECRHNSYMACVGELSVNGDLDAATLLIRAVREWEREDAPSGRGCEHG